MSLPGIPISSGKLLKDLDKKSYSTSAQICAGKAPEQL